MGRAVHPGQLGFDFQAPQRPSTPGELAGLDRLVAGAVASILKGDDRSRDEVAGAVSALSGDQVSKLMLDAYASEARETHNISAGRFFALIASTNRYDVLNSLCRRIGCTVLVGEEAYTAEVGHLDRQIAQLTARKRAVQAMAQPLVREVHQ